MLINIYKSLASQPLKANEQKGPQAADPNACFFKTLLNKPKQQSNYITLQIQEQKPLKQRHAISLKKPSKTFETFLNRLKTMRFQTDIQRNLEQPIFSISILSKDKINSLFENFQNNGDHKEAYFINAFNEDSHQAFEHFCNAIAKNTTLQSISIMESHLDDKHFNGLAQSILKHPGIQSINLSGNQLTSESILDIKHLLSKHASLKSIDLSENQLDDKGREELLQFSKNINKTIILG